MQLSKFRWLVSFAKVHSPCCRRIIEAWGIEAFRDPSYAGNDYGLGRSANGNFALTEFQMDLVAVPEPSVLIYIMGGLLGVGFCRRR